MKKSFAVISIWIMSVGIANAGLLGDVLINEVDSDTPSADVLEFVELYNTTGFSIDLAAGGYVLVFYNGAAADPVDGAYSVFDLTGTIAAGDYYVLGHTGVPNVDQAGIPTNLVQNGPDAIALYFSTSASAFTTSGSGATTPATAPGTLEDAVVYDTGDADDAALIAALTPGQPQIDEAANASSETESIQRFPDGAGGVLNTGSYVTKIATPGGVNVPVEVSSFEID